MANIPDIPNIPNGNVPLSTPDYIPNIPNGAPNIPNIPSGAPNIPNIPDGGPNIPNIPDGGPNIPNIPIDVPTTPITIPSKEKPDETKWILLTGDFQKNGAIISWLEKKDLENNCTSIEECTLSSLDKKIKEMKPGSSETNIAILPPDKSEFIYLYKGYKRNDLYYYRSSEEYRSGCTYRKTEVSIDELKEAAINYFTKSQLPDLENSELIDERLDDSKICEIRKEWKDKIPTEFIDKVLQNVYLFYSPEETESRIFRFISKLQAKDDMDFERVERMAKKEMKALLLEDIVLSSSQESAVTEIVQDMVQLLKKACNEKKQPDFSEIHERWDDKLPKDFIDKVMNNVNLFCSPEETEFKIFRYLDTMLNKDDVELDDIDGKIKKRLDNLLAENIVLTDSQKNTLSAIGNDMKQILIGHFEKIKAEKEHKKKEADRKKAEAKAKAEAETRKAEAALRQKQMEAEEKAKKEKSRKPFRFGCLSTILVIILFSWISSSIKSCQEDREREEAIAEAEANISEMKNQGLAEETTEPAVSADPTVKIDPSLDIQKQLEVYYDYVYSEEDGFYKIKKNNKYGLATTKGVVVCKPTYDYIYSKDDDTGLIKVQKDSKYGFLNAKGQEILAPTYDYLYSLDDDTGLIKVQKNSKYGFITTSGKLVVAPLYDYVYSVDDESGLMKVQKNSKYGFINPKTFKEVTPCIYSYIYSLDGGLYKVQIDNKTGFLNKDGSVFKNPE